MRAALVVLLAAGAGCRKLPQDPAFTGVAIWPDAGRHDGPIDLIVASRSAEAVACTVREADRCPSVGALVDALATLDPRERVRVDNVTCLTADIACATVGASASEPPVRTWSWEVLPPLADEGPVDEEDVVFDGWADSDAGTG